MENTKITLNMHMQVCAYIIIFTYTYIHYINIFSGFSQNVPRVLLLLFLF